METLTKEKRSGQKRFTLEFPGFPGKLCSGFLRKESEGFASPTQNQMENRQTFGEGSNCDPDSSDEATAKAAKQNQTAKLLNSLSSNFLSERLIFKSKPLCAHPC